MSILGTALWKRNLSLTDAQGWYDAGILAPSASGVRVTTEGALKLSAVYACVRILANTVASLPLHVYERQERGKRRADDFYLYDVLHNRPNPVMTSYRFRQVVMTHVALWGNGYAEIEWSQGGRVLALWPLSPAGMEKIEVVGDRLVYHYRLPDGKLERIPGDNILHIRALGTDGLLGLSPIALARQTVGLGLAAEEFGARFFGNGANVGGVLQHPGALSDKAYGRLKHSMDEKYGGISNAMRMMILEEGLTYQRVGIPPEDAQFLETRKFQVTDVARWYGIQPHLIADLDRSTNNNIEHQGIEFVVHTIRPWLVAWEQEIAASLLSATERRRYFAEFSAEGLLRGDAAARSQLYTSLFNVGAMSPNDIREKENMNPVEGGDEYFVQLNMVPVNMAAAGLEPVGEPAGNNAQGGRDLPTNDERAAAPDDAERLSRDSQRARGVAVGRQRLQRAHARIFADAMGRVLRREANDVGNAAKKLLGQRGLAEFDMWLREFYAGHMDWTMNQLRPVVTAYMELVARDAMREVGAETVDEGRVERFIQSWLGSFAHRHATKQEAKVRELMAANTDTLLADLEAQLELWRDEQRAFSIAQDETVRGGNAMAVTMYAILGMQFIRWMALGKSCPYCRALDGKVVAITETFIPAGTSFQPDGADVALVTRINIGHPPAHASCDCVTIAG